MNRTLYRWAARAKKAAPPAALRLGLQARSLVTQGPLIGLPPAGDVVAVAPHPDDETLAFGGTLARLADAGARIVLVVATDGEGSIGATGAPAETARRRRDEARRAAALLGVDRVVFAGLPDGGLAEHAASLGDVLRPLVAGADLVLTTWYGDDHPDHRAVTAALAGAQVPATAEIWGGEVWTPLTPNRIVPIDGVIERKRRATRIHRTAAGAFDLDAVLGLSRYRSVHGLAGEGHAEAFLAAPVEEYLAVARAAGALDGDVPGPDADALRLRRAGPEDTDALCRLIGEVFDDSPKADPEVLRWQYWDNPAGSAVSWVAEDDGRILAHYSVVLAGGTLDGAATRIAKPADVATVPALQRRGVMGRLARRVFADCAADGVPVTMCLPNHRARGAYAKLGMEEIDRLAAYVRPLDDGWVARRFHVPHGVAAATSRALFGRLAAPAGEPVDDVPADLDDLVARTRPRGATGIRHDRAWWRWRYVDAPIDYRLYALRRGGRLDAVAAVGVRDGYGARFLFLLDLIAADRDAARALVARVCRDRGDAVGIATLARAGSRSARLAVAAGLRRLPRRLEPQPVVLGLIRNDPEVVPPRPESWQVSWCDMDHL